MHRNIKTAKNKRVSPRTVVKILGIFVVCIYVTCTLVKQQITLSKYSSAKEEYHAKISEAQIENEKLNDELERAGTDEYLERVAREKLGLVKANERVFIDITKQ